jgi:hypothetical protein
MSTLSLLRDRLLRPIAWAILVAVAGLSGPASAVHNEGVFELDGNAVDDPAVPGIDWAGVYANPGAGQSFIPDPVNSNTDNNFTGGGSKDERDISKAGITNTFWQNAATTPPDKDDLEHAFAALYTVGTDEVIYFGADRYSNSGDSAIGFWFFKQTVKANPDGTFSGVHTVGDILVTSDFLQGGGASVINVFEWNGNAGSPLTLLAHSEVKNGVPVGGTIDPVTGLFCTTSDTACAVANKGDTAAPWPYTFKGNAAPNTFPHGTFFEGGINLTQLLGGTECFSSFMAMTRTAASTTAQLKDFVLGPFKNCSIAVSKTCNVTRVTTPADNTNLLYAASYSGVVTNTSDGALPVGTVITVRDDVGTPDPATADDQTQSFTLNSPLTKNATVPFSGSFFTNANPPHNTVYATASFSGNILTAKYDVDCSALALNPNISLTKICGSSDGTKPGTELVLNGGVLALKVNVSGQVCNTSSTAGLDLSVSVTDDVLGSPPNPVFSGALGVGQCANYDYSYFPTAGDGPTSPASAGIFTDHVTAVGSNPRLPAPVIATNSAHCKVCPAE